MNLDLNNLLHLLIQQKPLSNSQGDQLKEYLLNNATKNNQTLLELVGKTPLAIKENTQLKATIIKINKNELILKLNNDIIKTNLLPNQKSHLFFEGDKVELTALKKNQTILLNVTKLISPEKTFQNLLRTISTDNETNNKISIERMIQSIIQISKGLSTRESSIANSKPALEPSKTEAPLLNALNKISKSILPVPNLSNANVLKESILNSGLFYEQKLNNAMPQIPNNSNFSNDLKANILTLIANLKPIKNIIENTSLSHSKNEITFPLGVTETLINQLDSVLNKITYQQLQNTSPENNLLSWALNIPTTNDNAINIQIDLYKNQKKEKMDKKWSIVLELNLDKAKDVTFKLDVNKNMININIWAEDNITYHLINQYQHHLTSMLDDLGYSVDEINSYKKAYIHQKNNEKEHMRNIFDETV